jgi:MinD superfamily P-loop ATPase
MRGQAVAEEGSGADQGQADGHQEENRWSLVPSISGHKCQRSENCHDDCQYPVCMLFGRQKVRIDS